MYHTPTTPIPLAPDLWFRVGLQKWVTTEYNPKRVSRKFF